VELMIALVLGLLVTAAVTALTINSSQTQRELTKTSRQVENGRYAMQVLNDHVRHAGFFGRYHPQSTPPGSLPDPCRNDLDTLDADTLRGIFSLPMQAYESPDALSCISGADHVNGTDILVVRRTNTRAIEDCDGSNGSPAGNRLYLQSRPDNFILGNGNATFDLRELAADGSSCPAPVHRYRTDIFYVAPRAAVSNLCSDLADPDTRDVPTLVRYDVTGGQCNEPLVEGIDRILYDFGIDENGDGVPDDYVHLPADTSQWADVVALRINLLARSDDPTFGHADRKVYVMSRDGTLSVGPLDDEFRRRVFAATVRLVNPAGRREN